MVKVADPWHYLLWNPKKKTLLDRSFSSWIKILAFYAVYYSFLAVLFIGFLRLYKDQRVAIPGAGKKPTVNTRLGQPGMAVHPFNYVEAHKEDCNIVKKQVVTVELSPTGLAGHKCTKMYMDALAKIHSMRSGETGTKSANIPEITAEKVEKSIADKEPIIVMDLNKVIGWTPVNNRPKIQERNAVNFQCSEIDATGAPVEGGATVELIGKETYLKASSFPFNGEASTVPEFKSLFAFTPVRKEKSKFSTYSKPFVVGKVKGLKEGKLTEIRCSVLLDNIPTADGDSAVQTALDAHGVGSYKFGIKLV